jgi:hypothetical protein
LVVLTVSTVFVIPATLPTVIAAIAVVIVNRLIFVWISLGLSISLACDERPGKGQKTEE